jgi:predicted phosphodiesterase
MAIVGIIGDTHAPCMLPGYVDFLEDVFGRWGVTRVVHIGDLVDWSALSFHGTNPELPAVLHERAMANAQVSAISKAFPRADLMLGNHDVLPNRKAEAIGLSGDMLRTFHDYWGLPKGWRVHPRYEKIQIDGVIYCHGDQGPQGINAARNQALANFRSTVIGHLHQCGGVSWACNQDSRIFGMAAGCGVDHNELAMAYARPYKHKPFIGCGIVVDGVYAYVEPMIL